MGEVFLAQDTKLERKVAIKMLPAKSIDDALARKRLFREARAAATLDHPNICAIHEVNEDGDCLFIVMQYVEGKTLATRLAGFAPRAGEGNGVRGPMGGAALETPWRRGVHPRLKPSQRLIY